MVSVYNKNQKISVIFIGCTLLRFPQAEDFVKNEIFQNIKETEKIVVQTFAYKSGFHFIYSKKIHFIDRKK